MIFFFFPHYLMPQSQSNHIFFILLLFHLHALHPFTRSVFFLKIFIVCVPISVFFSLTLLSLFNFYFSLFSLSIWSLRVTINSILNIYALSLFPFILPFFVLSVSVSFLFSFFLSFFLLYFSLLFIFVSPSINLL